MIPFFEASGFSYEAAWGLSTVIEILVISLLVMFAVAMVIYADRKIWAAMALRKGPNVVGPLGLLQSFADGIKVFLQETIIPSAANKGLFLIAPIITFTVALMAWAVIPFNSGATLANINVGVLYVLAISSLGVYGVVIAGWSSNSKYPFFSAMRAAAQMISYEVSIGFILVCVVLWAGSFNLNDIVKAQQGHVWIINGFVANPLLFPVWVMFLISSLAETARAVRSDRGGKRTRRGLSDRILLDGLRALLAGRICQRSADVRAQRYAVLGRLAAAAGHSGALLCARHRVAADQDPRLLLHLQLGQGDGAALPL